MLGAAVFLPFYFDASTFFISAALILMIVPSLKSDAPNQVKGKIQFRAEIREGFGWLWRHELLRPMAIILGLMNLFGAMSTAVFILFAQEILKTSVFVFAILGMAGAVGGTIGGIVAPKISQRLGSGRSLALTLLAAPGTSLVVGLTSSWQVLWIFTVFYTIFAVLWNVITVSQIGRAHV